jgi:hypothetical protein
MPQHVLSLQKGRMMFVLGLILVAASLFALWLALPRNGQVRSFVGNQFLEHTISLVIVASGALGLVLLLSGTPR